MAGIASTSRSVTCRLDRPMPGPIRDCCALPGDGDGTMTAFLIVRAEVDPTVKDAFDAW